MSKKAIYILLKYDFTSVDVTDITFISCFNEKEKANELKNQLTKEAKNKNISYFVKEDYV